MTSYINSYRTLLRLKDQDSVVGIRTGRTRGQISNPGRVKNFLFSASSRPTLGPTQAPIPWVPHALTLEVKRPGSETDHSTPTSADVKKIWIYTSTPPYAFIA
jgi:hypothetical protein